MEVTFDATDSYDPDIDPLSYTWDFGDGGKSEDAYVIHGFGTAGIYTVSLKVTDSHGKSDRAELHINVTQASTSESSKQHFDSAEGTEYTTESGIEIAIQPQGFAEELELVVSEDTTPEQPDDHGIRLHCVLSISVEPVSSDSAPLARTERRSVLDWIRLTAAIEPNEDPHSIVLLEWTSNGWELVESGNERGGTLTPDLSSIYADVPPVGQYAKAEITSSFEPLSWEEPSANGWANPLGPEASLVTHKKYSYDSKGYEVTWGVRHAGVDIHAVKGAPVYAISDGRVVSINDGSDPCLNVVIIAHKTEDGDTFFAVYGHVLPLDDVVPWAIPLRPGSEEVIGTSDQIYETVTSLKPDLYWEADEHCVVDKGQQIGHIVQCNSTYDDENPAHLHFGVNISDDRSDFIFEKEVVGSEEKLKFGWGCVPSSTEEQPLSVWGWRKPIPYLESNSPASGAPEPPAAGNPKRYYFFVRKVGSDNFPVDTLADGITVTTSPFSIPEELEWAREYCWNVGTHDKVDGWSYSETLYFETASESPIIVPTSLEIDGPDQVVENETGSFSCTATFSDNSIRVVTTEADWDLSVSSSRATIANGTLTVKSLSSDLSCVVTAEFESNNVTVTDTMIVTLKNDPPIIVPTSLQIDGPDQVGENKTGSFSCTATFSDNSIRVVTTEADWDLSVSSSRATIDTGELTVKPLSSDVSCVVTAEFESNNVKVTDSMTVTLKDDPPEPDLSFDDLDPTTIQTSDSYYRADLTATGSNFENVTRVTFTWTGPDSGIDTWDKGTSDWNSSVVVHSDSSMTLKPWVLYNATSSESQTWNWTVTLRDSSGNEEFRSFTVQRIP